MKEVHVAYSEGVHVFRQNGINTRLRDLIRLHLQPIQGISHVGDSISSSSAAEMVIPAEQKDACNWPLFSDRNRRSLSLSLSRRMNNALFIRFRNGHQV